MIGKVISGRYQIIQSLGSGGFGQTFLAEDLQLPDHHQCVVKRLQPMSSDNFVLEIAGRLFETEAKVLHKLGNHDRIPRLLAHFEEDHEFYLVQELIDGDDLTNELNSVDRSADGYPIGRMNEARAIAFLIDVLEILVFVHQQGAIHRDIKPANLMRRRIDGKLVLIDFGAVKQVGTAIASNVGSTVAIGTDGYMPNEQAIGKPRPCSDLYAVGAIAIQGLTGVAPNLLSENLATGELAWRKSPDHAALKYQAKVSDEFARIIDKLIKYDFRDRYQSAETVLVDLRKLNQIAPTLLSTTVNTDFQELTSVLTPNDHVEATFSPRVAPKDRLQFIPQNRLVIIAVGMVSAIAFSGAVIFVQPLLIPKNASNSLCDYNKRLVDDPKPPINVRRGAGVNFEVIGKLDNGTQITVQGEREGWLQISAPIAGWVASNRTKPICL